MADMTPMMKQYHEIKEQNKDAILFFRLGDFYEMFSDDALLASRELDLTLTTRDRAKPEDERTPMCGVPYHSAQSYIARLIKRGYKVAICEQMEDPAAAKGLVDRDVIRIVTPGTAMDDVMLDEGRNNYICAVYQDSAGAALARCDLSTGQFSAAPFLGRGFLPHLLNALAACPPSEALLSDAAASNSDLTVFLKERLGCLWQRGEEVRFRPAQAADWMKGHGFADIQVRDYCPDLRFLHYEREGGSVYFFTNESKWNTVDTRVTLREDGRLAFYDAMEDVRYPLLEEIGIDGADGTVTFRLVLEPYQSVFVVPEAAGEAGGFAEMGATGETGALNRAELSGKSGERPIPLVDEAFVAARREKRLEGAWRISVLRETGEYEALNGLTEITNISAADILPEYSGRICYETSFELESGAGPGEAGTEAVLDLGQVYEISDVELNGRFVGNKICPPHLYRLECRPGRNELRIIVTNTFAKEKMGNVFDRAMPQEPSGLLGPVRLYL